MKPFKMAWQAIADDFPGMYLWQQVVWVVFFIPLYLLAVGAAYFSEAQMPKVKKDE